MVSTLDDPKRQAIAMQLADMRALQNLLIANEQTLMQTVDDKLICQRLQDMVNDDQKNLGVLDTVIVQYGVKGEPKETTQELIETAKKLIQGSQLSVYEKFSQHELLKHQQTMAGLIVHKAAQVVGADVEAAITPLNTVNFENRAHQEQLKGILEVLGVRELTGQNPVQGLWARVQDGAAALTGVVGSVVTRTDEEMSIRDLLLMDHTKADTLFAEIQSANDPQKVQEYFGQLYRDVKVHGLAEEQVLYPAVRPYYEHTQEIYEQTDEVIQMLEEIKLLNPSDSGFKAKVEQLRIAARAHIDQEESDIFPKLKNFSDEQQKQMASEFKAVKSQLQDQMAASTSVTSSQSKSN